MSNAAESASTSTSPGSSVLREAAFDAEERDRIERAVDVADYEGPVEFLREGALRLVDEVLDEDGELDCPHDDCDRTFATVRERRGHLGSSEHAVDVPEGDFWCGYCGHGPTTWRGVNAHHGSSNHDGDPVRLDEGPSREDLIAPDDIPDHKNPDLLARLYRKHDGNYTAMCRAYDFEVGPGRVRHYLIEFGIHDVTPQGQATDDDAPDYRDPEWLQERYDAANGNISAMHRALDVDVPYRTLQKNLKKFGIHDPVGRDEATVQPNEVDPSDADVDEESATSEDDSDEEADVEDVAVDEVPSQTDPRVDDPVDVESFADLATPDWLDEHSFYAGVEMADDIDGLAEVLGWDAPDRLERMVELLDIEADLNGGENGG